MVLCGPGNNGGDGFVVARLLKNRGWPIRVALLGDRGQIKGDAATNADLWDGDVVPLGPGALQDVVGVVDALFGAGLARPLDGVVKEVVETINARQIRCIGVDVPSGIDGNTGEIRGAAPVCEATVTFFRPKPGHLLYPGRAYAGSLAVVDIGIPDDVLEGIGPRTFINGPALWEIPEPTWEDHKYSRGHCVVFGGRRMTGAGRLAVRGARRIGSGLVTIAAPEEVIPVYAADAPGALTWPLAGEGDLDALLGDARRNAFLLGPGGGHGDVMRDHVLKVLATGRSCILDADALTSFADQPEALFDAIEGPTVLTPHEGEFNRLFGIDGDKQAKAREAARRSGAVVLLKGPDTVVAAPSGRVCITTNAPFDLATAGAGDVLAGFVLGLLAQGLPPFEAAAAAAWLHGEAAWDAGPGLIAEDLPEALRQVFRRLRYPNVGTA
jgi:hydroxyethylthiazole kinase-like uncharacterized protein yjeF